MNKKIIFLITALSFGVLFVILLLNMASKNSNQPINGLPNPTSSPIPPTEPEQPFSVISVFPEPESSTYFLPFQKITVIFSEAVSPEDIELSITPEVEIDIFQGGDGSEVFIAPTGTWPIGTTQITILDSSTSIEGGRLTIPYQYNITTALPTLSPEELQDIHP